MPDPPSDFNLPPTRLGAPSAEATEEDAEARLLAFLATFFDPPRATEEMGWLEDYRVLGVLGRGGMGMVFRAEDTNLQRPVALKVMLPETAAHPVARERFQREARAAAALKSDHIVTVYHIGVHRDVPYLAMELLKGQSLDDLVQRSERLTPLQIARIGREACLGLAVAHESGLIHRDIKPANLWLEPLTDSPDPSALGRVKVLDFGLARPVEPLEQLTRQGIAVGTPEFMSPEQARGAALDGRSDLFSLGVVLYQLCTGWLPFPGDDIMALMMALATKPPRPIRERNPDIPPALAALVERLLAKEPEDRPASAREAAAAFAAIEGQLLGNATTSSSGVQQFDTLGASGIRTPPHAASAPTLDEAPAWRGRPPRRLVLLGAGALLVAGLLALVVFRGPWGRQGGTPAPNGEPVRIGVLHSETGTMEFSERPIRDAIQLAVEEINDQGGVLGRPVEIVSEDGRSDEEVFAQKAEKLITQDKVCTLFGCWTSASRKAVKEVVERHDHLLVYSVQYEGLEQSPNIVYTGAVPNQQIVPALQWFRGFRAKRTRWFLIGSDYVFPRAANRIIRHEAEQLGVTVVGEEYVRLGEQELGKLMEKVAAADTDLIVNTLNGDSNVGFFRALAKGTFPKDRPATLSFSVAEHELRLLDGRIFREDYAAWNYFMSIKSETNEAFLRRYAAKYGVRRRVSDPMQTSYASVHLWAQAVRAAGSTDVAAIREAMKGQRYDAPQGPMEIDPATGHTAQYARIGRITEEGLFTVVYTSEGPIAPEPFPPWQTKAQWQAFLEELHRRWHGRWSAPAE